MTLKDLKKLVGSEIPWKVNGIEVTVIVKDCRSVYGRLEAQIEPLRGEGDKWVNIGSLALDLSPDPEAQREPAKTENVKRGFEVI